MDTQQDDLAKISELSDEKKKEILKIAQPTQTSNKVLLLKKLYGIMTDVGEIAKDKTNTFHKYKYASEYAIKTHLRPLFIKYGLIFKFEVTGFLRQGENTLINARYTFIDSDTGEEFTGEFGGEGSDKGDKSLYKAVTGAIKYVLTSNFFIPTGDDPEDEEAPRKTKQSSVTTDERTKLNNWLNQIAAIKTKEDGRNIQSAIHNSPNLTDRDVFILKKELSDKAKQITT